MTKRLRIGGSKIPRGTSRDLALDVSQSYSGSSVTVPVRVVRARREGPTLLLTAAVHGDELNGIGILREVLTSIAPRLIAGTLILVPVVNILGFERHARYLPDRRDLNRCFPGSPGGSMASRLAHTIFSELVRQADACIDFHTAAVRRTNFPNVRGDLGVREVRRLAKAFGCELMVDHAGAKGTLRRAATDAGVPTLVLEAGEVWKIEPSVVELGTRGVRNVLVKLGMIDGKREKPAYQAIVQRTTWIRSNRGGVLSFHTAPGEVVEKDQPIASCLTLLGHELGVVRASEDGVVMGLTTLPLVKPGDPVCHLAIPRKGVERIRRAVERQSSASLHGRLRDDLATNVTVDEAATP